MTNENLELACDLLPPKDRQVFWFMPFLRGPLHGQTRSVLGWLDHPCRPSVPDWLWHVAEDGSQHAYRLVADDDLAEHPRCPVYVCDRSFPAPDAGEPARVPQLINLFSAPADAPAN